MQCISQVDVHILLLVVTFLELSRKAQALASEVTDCWYITNSGIIFVHYPQLENFLPY